MAHPLANKSSEVSGTVNFPVIGPPPKVGDFIKQFGFRPAAFEAYDKAHGEWVERLNEGITKTFKALKDNS